ncbi:tryptophan 7-halogenase [Aestuariicella hydrocarbonica]|uniref:Tryptophan 7-halogenase n=1 Tax=Pseudomaricurvus hydrocarbonicus TaxID=1470433 RepID=A0A9E5JUX2_9GAMM|nr:tryptophan halogenase family protein [Aestuariicella hydrocarbonica]NHO65025.1 tryptophan 7-halogenase [Aestuariicella hydrocarbonica]
MSKPEHIIVVGGGTAGWMAACLLSQAWGISDKRQDSAPTRVTLIESADIDTIGVGEGSTPYMREFFKRLGITEKEWMPACNATYKCGISFPEWSTKPGHESYFHPFFSQLDLEPAADFFNNCNLRRRGQRVAAHPDEYFVAAELARQQLSPIPRQLFEFEHDYAYHFDAGLLATFLKNFARTRGVKHVIDNVTDVALCSEGNIKHLATGEHGCVTADVFFDCSGFASLLMGKALQEPFIAYSDTLFNDRAVALPTPLDARQPIPSDTVSRAASAGWMWRIPLTTRYGNGYVYSSRYLSAEAAEQELRQQLGAEAEGVEARHLKMRVGRVSQHWKNNCVAAGLSQGFIEPLEATAIGLIQFTVERFIEHFEKGGFTDVHRQSFNDHVNKAFDGTRDYVSLHYRLNSRDDTAYWRDSREQGNTSASLAKLMQSWEQGTDFDAALTAEKAFQIYMRPSWYAIFSGMGHYPEFSDDTLEDTRSAERSRRLCRRTAKKFKPHHANWLMAMGQ